MRDLPMPHRAWGCRMQLELAAAQRDLVHRRKKERAAAVSSSAVTAENVRPLAAAARTEAASRRAGNLPTLPLPATPGHR
jgi:hypothetical protein